jgi:hypothetical protein
MRLFRSIAAGLQSLLRRKETEQELDEELGAFPNWQRKKR